MTVNAAFFVTACAEALIVTVVVAAGLVVRTVNVPFVAPAATTIDAVVGAATAVFVLDSATVMPPDGAAHSVVATPLTGFPPTTDDGVSTRLWT